MILSFVLFDIIHLYDLFLYKKKSNRPYLFFFFQRYESPQRTDLSLQVIVWQNPRQFQAGFRLSCCQYPCIEREIATRCESPCFCWNPVLPFRSPDTRNIGSISYKVSYWDESLLCHFVIFRFIHLRASRIQYLVLKLLLLILFIKSFKVNF